MPGNHHDSLAYQDSGVDQHCTDVHVMADGGYLGNPQVIIPYCEPGKGKDLPERKEDLNIVHKSIRARVEHALAHLKSWNILRNCRRKADGVWYALRDVVQMRNLGMTC